MKTSLIVSFLFLISSYNSLSAYHGPNKIYSLSRQNFSADYYHEQVALWKKELDKNQQNSEAWFNYFMAHQALHEKGKLDHTSLVLIQQDLQKALPNSFESSLSDYFCHQNIASLLKAYEINPNRYETYAALLSYYETRFDRKMMQQISTQWLASGEYSDGMLHWNYNALIGLEKDALILTEGDNHTHPLWLLQHGKALRHDVQVLNLDLLTEAAYRSKLFEQLDIELLLSNNKEDIVKHLTQQIKKQALYLGISVPKTIVKDYEEELYIIGLAFRHNKSAFDNLTSLVDNYENHFLLDYLKVPLSHDISQDWVKQNNVNYIPAFLVLHDYYQENNEWGKANDIKNLSLKIADAAERGEELRNYLDKNFNNGGSKPLVELSHREIESDFAALPYSVNLYAGLTEVSNQSYELFLTDLLKRKEFDQLQARKIYTTDWRSFLPAKHKNLSEEELYKNGKPADPNNPIQNISYESAVAYCEWLTAVYNNIEHKKKKFKRVRFRLPTEAEWMAAASVLSPNRQKEVFEPAKEMIYPWDFMAAPNDFGPGRNERGCFLANFKSDQAKRCEDCKESQTADMDGAFFTVHVDAYFPNNLGLFNTIGNVAEMIQEKGKAKGGSWFHLPEASTINGVQNYTEPQPYLGFRVFMEVLNDESVEHKRQGPNGPPNTFQLKEKLYMDASEIDNFSWLEYQYWLKKNAPEQYEASIIDTTVWLDDLANNEPFANNYYQHPAYQSYPLVGVTHAQAKAYCTWRSKVVNQMLQLNPNGLKKFGSILYRLPTKKEWEYAASAGLNTQTFPYGFKEVESSNGQVAFNVKLPNKSKAESASITAPTFSYKANNKGYYNMIGNVAEMVEEVGIAKGGSWKHTLDDSKITTDIPYTKQSSWLGFRCICETNL